MTKTVPATTVNPEVRTCVFTSATEACFESTGEHLINCDLAPDGHHPEIFYVRSTSPSVLRNISDAPQAGNCVDHNLADIPESGFIVFQSCNYEGDTELGCTPFIEASAAG